MIHWVSIFEIIMAIIWLYLLVIFSSSFLGVYISEISLWFSWIPISCIALAIPYMIQFSHEAQPSVDLIILSICLVAFIGVFLRIIIPFLQIRRTNKRFKEAMKQSLGENYLEEISPAINSCFYEEVKFKFASYVKGSRMRKLLQRVNTVEAVTYRSLNDQDLALNVYYPKREGIFPVIIFIHGGGWISGSKDLKSTIRVCMVLANIGYTVFNIDYRLAPLEPFIPWKEHPHEHTTIREMVSDVRSAIIFAKENASKYKGDANATFLFGRSAGAHLALLTAFSCHEDFFAQEGVKCGVNDVKITSVVAFYPITNLKTLYEQSNPTHPVKLSLIRGTGGTIEEKSELYTFFSPVSYITEKNKGNIPPIFLVAGKKDRLITSEQSVELNEKLIENNITSVFFELPWANHIFDYVIYGPGGQLVFKYLTQFFAWTYSQKQKKKED